MQCQPLFVLGAPRSGTTFLCCALNQHPSIALTSESRIFVLLKDLVEARTMRPDLLEPEYAADFQAFARRHAGEWAEQFYRESLGVAAPIWGDKHTSYGDPAVLSGRTDGIMSEPVSGSCLHLIRDCLPGAKFIHLHRHPWQVAASMHRRGWVGSISAGLQVWRQHVGEIQAFLDGLPASQRLTLGYTDLVGEPETVAAEIGALLGLGAAMPIASFLAAQRIEPTPFSSPTTDLRQPLALRLPEDGGRAALRWVADVAGRLGYADSTVS